MGFRFRKSINLGSGFKVNLSKSGVGYSWGTKGVRFTKTASGKNRTTLRIPGTGVSYVAESRSSRKTANAKKAAAVRSVSPDPDSANNGGDKTAWGKFILCFFFGPLGVHKFMEKKIGMGIVYLFTMGLFGFGWIYDCVRYFMIAINGTKANAQTPIDGQEPHTGAVAELPSPEIPESHVFPVKKVLLWVLTVFLTLIALAYFPHVSCIIALAAAVIAAPIEKWQCRLSQFIAGKKKAILIAVLAILALVFTPTAVSHEKVPAGPIVAATETTQSDNRAAAAPAEAETALETLSPAEVTGISFGSEGDIIGVGRTVEVPFVLHPENASENTLEVSIDHPEVAAVTFQKGDKRTIQVTGIAPGNATVTLKSGEAVAAAKSIAVAAVMPEQIHITAAPQIPRIGSDGAFTVVFDPVDVTNSDVVWESDAPNVLQVDENGRYKALSLGKATVTATHESGVSGTIQLEVLPVEVETVLLSTDREESKPLYKNDSITLTAEIRPENAADKTLTWSSSDESVATVSGRGVVKALSPGTAIITATAVNGETGTYEIVVDVSPQKFRISASISMKSNDHVGNRWTTGFEFNDEAIRSVATVSIMPGETFTACGWAQDNDSKPDYGSYLERLTLTNEMCKSGFTIEGEANVYENGGRYSGNCAVWHVKMTFTPIN